MGMPVPDIEEDSGRDIDAKGNDLYFKKRL